MSLACPSAVSEELGSLAWHLRIDAALPGPINMARDHALALSLPIRSAVLRLYRWERPTLSFGRNEPARGRYDPAAIQRMGIDVVRRPTGGRAVLHWRELTYAVAAPLRGVGGVRAAYEWINGRLAAALASLGVPAEIARDPSAPSPLDAGPCFQAAAGGEVTAGGRKLVGSAQVRIGDVLLQHGSILIGDDQGLLAELRSGAAGETGGPATLSELMGRLPEPGEIEGAVIRAFGATECLEGGDSTSPIESELEERYRSEAWTWRR